MSSAPPDDRLIALETALAHLQRQVEQLHEVILGHQTDITAIRRELQRAEGKLDQLAEPAEPPDPLTERPPHY